METGAAPDPPVRSHARMRPMEPRISLITLGVADLGRSYRFYKEGLGLPTTRSPEDGIVFLPDLRRHPCAVPL
jgi:catechol-2,3-dioxygenase